MAQKLDNYITVFFLLLFSSLYSQEGEPSKTPVYKDFRSDTTFKNFNALKNNVAKTQINELKNGALLVRLKTNANTINKLKAAGNIDLATQVERETYLKNKTIVRGFVNEFKFCPVYFFYSNCSDSVKHKNLANIFLDTNLVINSSISCQATFYLVAEQGAIYESSLGFVPEELAPSYSESGTQSKEVAIVIKNRYYFQLHKPFPYYQAGYNYKKYRLYVKKFNSKLTKFYLKNLGYKKNEKISNFVY